VSEESNRATISTHINDIDIEISGPSAQWEGRDLQTAAILGLIEMSHTHSWEKDVLEQHGDYGNVSPGDQFYAALLSGIARHYAVDAALETDMPVASVLFRLIGELVEKERLNTIIRQGQSGEEDGEVYDEM